MILRNAVIYHFIEQIGTAYRRPIGGRYFHPYYVQRRAQIETRRARPQHEQIAHSSSQEVIAHASHQEAIAHVSHQEVPPHSFQQEVVPLASSNEETLTVCRYVLQYGIRLVEEDDADAMGVQPSSRQPSPDPDINQEEADSLGVQPAPVSPSPAINPEAAPEDMVTHFARILLDLLRLYQWDTL